MRVLALDTSLGATSVSIYDFPAALAVFQHSEPMERGHAEALMPLVARSVEGVEGGFGSLDRIAVTVGPGSFTGLRVAVAAARAMGLGLEIPVVGVSTLVAYAAPFLAQGARATIASAVDARHGMVFFQSFWLDGRRAFGPGLCSVEEAVSELRGGPARLAGNAAPLVAAAARRRNIEAEVADDAPAPGIAWIARLGAAADPLLAPARPLYLRETSARPQAGAAVARA
jgi:tRNA threonylcarbamoyladenosine biosynthesis protein TsaB